MNRVIVFLLAAFDALVAAAVSLAIALAPLTALWIFGFGGQAPWELLWTTAAKIWQLGHLVPLALTLPGDYVSAAGIDPGAASFTLSLAPLAVATITVISAARSGARASASGAAWTGALSGAVVFAAAAAGIAVTSPTSVAAVDLVLAIALPAALFAAPALIGATVGEWREADSGPIAAMRDALERGPAPWRPVVAVSARAAAIAVTGLIGAGAAVTAVALVARGGQIVGLYEAAHVDLAGAVLLTVVHLLYLPTLIVWAVAFVAGPGVTLGAGTAVSPAGTQTGVLPGVPLLGVIPDSTSPWLLLLALVPVAIGAFAGWVARSLLVQAQAESPPTGGAEPVGPRLVVTMAVAVLAAAGAALLALAASGSLGPGTLADVGPQAGPVALAVGVEIGIGAGILLLSPRRGIRHGDDAPPVGDGFAAAPPAPRAAPPSPVAPTPDR